LNRFNNFSESEPDIAPRRWRDDFHAAYPVANDALLITTIRRSG
jgi:hypothetical protein